MVCKFHYNVYLLNIYLGGKDIRKSGILIVLLLAGILFVSGCAENAQDNKTGTEEEERASPVEGTTPNLTEVTEPEGVGAGQGSIPGQEENSPIEGEEGITPGEEELGQGNESFAENQTSGNNQTVQTAEGAGYTTFASLVRAAGLEDTLNNGGPYTIFAPTDIAFESLPEGMLDDLSNDKEKLSRVLTYHVIIGEYMASDLKNMNSLTSLETGKLAVNVTADGAIMVENATVIEPDIIAGNGVIHGIDKVLVPSGV